jgi:two-component system CheB/CheR fusion protein
MAKKRPRRRARKVTGAKAATPARRSRRAPTRADRAPAARVADQSGPITALVGLGSSAGGLEALKAFFGAMPADSGMAFILVQHLDPAHGSLMAELLGRCTAMPVVQVQADTPVEGGHVYCIPPGKYLSIEARTLRLTAPVETASVRMAIDFFFRSLAADVQEQAIGIVLAGTGTDGTLGLRAIRAAGGLAVSQDPTTAEHDGMPRSAIAAGAVDHVLSPADIPRALLEYVRHPYARGGEGLSPAKAIGRDHLSDVLAIVRDRTAFDFRSYKRSTLERRIGRRMGLKHVERLADYVRILRDDPAEAGRLFNDLLISVTSFFRDPDTWRLLQERVIRPLVERKSPDAELRVWVPGCAPGEEAYSIGMSFIEGISAARKPAHLQIFASDVDANALDVARAGLYPASIAADVPPERLRRFFVEEDHTFRVSQELRESVVFARQNLVADPPFSRLDLICCRNLLMYLAPEVQKRVVSLLHFALVENGYLVLGTAETVGQEDRFEAVSKKARIFRRVGPTRHDRLEFAAMSESPREPSSSPTGHMGPGRFGPLAQQLLLDRFVPACVVINRRNEIQYLAGRMQDYLLEPSGVPTQDVMLRMRDGLQAKLRAAIRGAVARAGPVEVTGARVRRGNDWQRVRITAEPFGGVRQTEGLLLISFLDEPKATPAPASKARGGDEPILRHLEEELMTAREDLRSTVQELESSNQETRVVNEEVMSVNEELRCANEELETSKEELQSLNEELNTVNAQLESKVSELERTTNDLDNLLTSTNIATIFLDTSFRVRRFTPPATRLFSLVPTDVGRPLVDIARRCQDPELLPDAERVLESLTAISAEVRDEGGRPYIRQVLPYRTRDDHVEGVVVTFSDVAADVLQEERLHAEAIVETVRESLLVLDADLRVLTANRSFYEAFGLTPEETLNHHLYELHANQLDVPGLRQLLGDILRERGALVDFEIEFVFPTRGPRALLLNARTLARRGGRPDRILLAVEDVTERKHAERTLRESEAMTRAGVRSSLDGVVTIDEHRTVLSFNPAAEQLFGYSAQEVIGQNVRMLARRSDHAGVDGYLASDLEKGAQDAFGGGFEIHAQRKDGTVFPVDLHVSAFDDGAGRRFVGTIRDITSRKQTEDKLRRQQAELAHVLRLATIERLAAGLAHELNQPLSAIANGVEACAAYVRSGKRGPRRLLALLDQASAEALRAGEIVHHVREFVQRSEPRLEATDLCEVVRNATRWLVREMEQERITLRLDLPPAGLTVLADRIQIEQVLVNLIQNAVDAIREAGKSVRQIRVRAAQSADGMAEVAVHDSGTGLSAETAERLHEPFFTTKPQGMGMGLAISRTIVEAHNGRLTIDTRALRHGTTVRVALPLDRGSAISP